MSYQNMIMYGRALPSYRSRRADNTDKGDQERISADDPRNRDRIREIYKGLR